MNTHKQVALIILDGFGYRKEREYNAIAQADMPFFSMLLQEYPHTLLQAAGSAVGLLEGAVGNSEVGHLTIGIGRVIQQALTRIHTAIDNHELQHNRVLHDHFANLHGTLHIMGLLSDAGVHSHEKHLYAYLEIAHAAGIRNIVIHPFLDGRDTAPQSAERYLTKLEAVAKHYNAIIGSLHGRFYAMDRDKNWQRTEKSFQILTNPQQPHYATWRDALDHYYNNGITDEFIPPTALYDHRPIRTGDGILFFNIRADRARQLTELFSAGDLAFFITPTNYGATTKTTVLFEQPPIQHTLKECLARTGKKIFTIAETEKYAHVTYFFSGGRQQLFPGEQQVMVPSIRAPNYIEYPAMSAQHITQTVCNVICTNPYDFYLINYANPDMVGHSGDLAATIKAVEYVDGQLAILYQTLVIEHGGTMIITADHGNAEDKWDLESNQPRTSHTTNPVPFIVAATDTATIPAIDSMHSLADIAGYVASLYGLRMSE